MFYIEVIKISNILAAGAFKMTGYVYAMYHHLSKVNSESFNCTIAILKPVKLKTS